MVESGAPLAIWKQKTFTLNRSLSTLMVPMGLEIRNDLPSSAEISTAHAACTDSFQAERVRRKLAIRQLVGEENKTTMPLWGFRLGDDLIVGQPNEAYSHFQKELRKAFP